MNSIAFSIIFTVLFLGLISGIYLTRKTQRTLNSILWIVPSLFMGMFFMVLPLALFNIIGIKVNLITASVVCLLEALPLWYTVIFKKTKQSYSFNVTDLIAFLLICGVAVFYGIREFGTALTPLYETSDPAVHLQMAMDVINTGMLNQMFFAPLINSLAISVASPFVEVSCYYKLFVLLDIFFFAVSGLTVYSLMADRVEGVVKKVIALVMTAFYMILYPLNNMVFGFVYLGISVSVLATIIFILRYLGEKDSNKIFFSLALTCSLLSLSMCYILFAPVVYAGALIYVSYFYVKEKNLFRWNYFIRQFLIFGIPALITVYYFIIRRQSTSMDAVSCEGYIYKSLIANFILLIFPVLAGIVKAIKNKEFKPEIVFFVLLMGQVAVTLFLGLKGKFSSYYFFKAYYPLSLVCFAISFFNVEDAEKNDIYKPICYLSAVVLLFGTFRSRIETKIQNFSVNFCPERVTYSLFDIYNFNIDRIGNDYDEVDTYIWNMRLDLYKQVASLNPDNNIYLVDSWEKVYWYEAITNQRFENYLWGNYDDFKEFYSNCDYAVIIPSSDEYQADEPFFDQYTDKVYENDYGYVVKLK